MIRHPRLRPAPGRARPGGAAAVAVAIGLSALAGSAACGSNGSDRGRQAEGVATTSTASSPTPSTSGGPRFSASLSGAEEVPGPGVTDGVGVFSLDIGTGRGCYDLSATMGETPTGAHLHQGARGGSGPVIADLAPSFTRGEAGFLAHACVALPAGVLDTLRSDPTGVYVNVNSAAHPLGALRGQLRAAP